MGLSEHWVAVRTPAAKAPAASEAVRKFGLDDLGEHGGWVWGRGWPTRADTDDLVVEIANAIVEPVLGAYVVDSDFAYVVGSSPDGIVAFQLAVSEPYDEDEAHVRLLGEQWRSAELKEQAAKALADWSERFAPAAVTPESVLYALRDDADTPEPGMGPVFAEDALREIFTEMGFPSLDRTVFLADLVAEEELEEIDERPSPPASAAASAAASAEAALEWSPDELALIEEELDELRASLAADDPEQARLTQVMIDVLEQSRTRIRESLSSKA